MTGSPSRVEFLTVCYRGDLERFGLMRRTLRAFCSEPIKHVLAVPRRDIPLFAPLAASDPLLRIVAKNDFLPASFYPAGWYSALTRVLPGLAWQLRRHGGRRGWYRQQVVKLAAPEISPADTIVVVDADNIFVSPFGQSQFVPSGEGRYLVRQDPSPHVKHLQLARAQLGSTRTGGCQGYIGTIVPLERRWLIALQEHMARRHHVPWKTFFRNADHYSEYTLYGAYVDEVLQPPGVVPHPPFQTGIWVTEEFSGREGLLDLICARIRDARAGEQLCVAIQSNLHHAVAEYEPAVLESLGLSGHH